MTLRLHTPLLLLAALAVLLFASAPAHASDRTAALVTSSALKRVAPVLQRVATCANRNDSACMRAAGRRLALVARTQNARIGRAVTGHERPCLRRAIVLFRRGLTGYARAGTLLARLRLPATARALRAANALTRAGTTAIRRCR